MVLFSCTITAKVFFLPRSSKISKYPSSQCGKISTREIDKLSQLCYNSIEYEKGGKPMFQITAQAIDQTCVFVSVTSSFSIFPGI